MYYLSLHDSLFSSSPQSEFLLFEAFRHSESRFCGTKNLIPNQILRFLPAQAGALDDDDVFHSDEEEIVIS